MSKDNSVAPISTDDHLDTPIWGAKAIALAAGIVDKNGDPDERAAFYQLEMKHIPAKKVGRQYVTTRRQIRSIATS